MSWATKAAAPVAASELAALPEGLVPIGRDPFGATRNPSGVSHSAEEDVSLEDAAVGANAILIALEALL